MTDQRPQAQIPLTDPVESLLQTIYMVQKLGPISPETRLRLSSVSDQVAVDTLQTIVKSPVKRSLDGFINFLLRKAGESPRGSPVQHRSPATTPPPGISRGYEMRSPKRLMFSAMPERVNGGSMAESPQLVALGELEFRKAFIILSYLGENSDCLEDVISADEIRRMKDLPMVKFESEVWNLLGLRYCQQEDRRRSLEWDRGKTHCYHCYVSQDGRYRFKGPFLESTKTHLQRVIGDENVLIVKFAEVREQRDFSNNQTDHYLKYKMIAKQGIMVGLRRYRFFVFKDGGKEEKKKDPSTKGVKCYFVRTESRASIDLGIDYILSGKMIHEARALFMHVHTLPSLARYMARFSLILSKTKNLEVDLADVNVETIADIPCFDEHGNDVYDKKGEPLIHSDGTGFISEDLAWRCPTNVFKGKCMSGVSREEFKGKISDLEALEPCRREPPLLIQFRMFYNGCAVKGTVLLNKKLPPRTIQVRPSMIKVKMDLNLLNFSTKNALEVVSTSNQPKRAKLSRNLIALLSYGGVPNEFFLDLLFGTLEEAKGIFSNRPAALKASLNYGDMDDLNAARMILSGIPLEEAYLQHHLSILFKTEKNDLKSGKLPIDESYYLMGTVDPTGILESNEVCIILESGQISGQVLVYRNPGLHFGDVHRLKATYVKAMEDFVGNAKYGIFFPQKGPRSLADEIAGGDYDGDMYFVSRNPELLKLFTSNEPWVCASSTSNKVSGRKPSDFAAEELEKELFNLFLTTRFQPSNATGLAADSWLAIMDRLLVLGDDRSEEKAQMKEIMLQLIDIYYDALDAPKKGTKITLPGELRPDLFPHYMERERCFKSTSVLGLIYDVVKSYQTEDLSTCELRKLPCFEDDKIPEPCMDKWRKCYESYRSEMSKAMQLANGDEKKEIANEIVKRYKLELYGASGFEESKKSLAELCPEALAIYHTVYDYAIATCSVQKCGFAWKVAGAVLCRIYLERQGDPTMLCSSTVLKEVLGRV